MGEFEIFVNTTLDRYDPGMGNIDAPRGINDLSPLELWLLHELFYEGQVVDNLIKNDEEY